MDTVFDCRGVEILPGAVVAITSGASSLELRSVKRLQRGGWTTDEEMQVRFGDGSWTTPDRCAVVASPTEATEITLLRQIARATGEFRDAVAEHGAEWMKDNERAAQLNRDLVRLLTELRHTDPAVPTEGPTDART